MNDLDKLIKILDDKVLFPVDGESILDYKKEDLEFECKGASAVLTHYLNEYKKINTINDLCNFDRDLTYKGVGFGFCPRSVVFMDFLTKVCGYGLADQSYTRNPVEGEDDTLKDTLEWVREKTPNFEENFSQHCEAAKLLKQVIINSLQKNECNLCAQIKFAVRNDPDAFDIIQYILCAEELRAKKNDNIINSKENINNKEEFILPNDEVYVQHFLCKFAQYALISQKNCFDNKLSEKDKQKLFDLFLKLRDKKGNATELALEFVDLLKNYITPENLKLLKEKGFLEKVDAGFAKVLGLENKIVDNTELINLGEGNINN